MNNICISIRSLKRVDYLERCIESLKKNKEINQVDFFLVQDGYHNIFSQKEYATKEEIKASEKMLQRSGLPNVTFFRCMGNCGASYIKKYQLGTLFEGFGYEYVVLIDNDIEVNPYFIKTHLALYEQFKNKSNIASVQTSFRHTGNNFQLLEEAKQLEDKIAYGFSHRCEIGLFKRSWEKIEKEMRYYWNTTSTCDFRELLYNKNVYKKERENLLKVYNTEHCDFSLEKSIERARYKGIHTLTNRYKIIGAKGMYSFRESRFNGQQFEKVQLHDVGDINNYYSQIEK